jgi:hypothetical protein
MLSTARPGSPKNSRGSPDETEAPGVDRPIRSTLSGGGFGSGARAGGESRLAGLALVYHLAAGSGIIRASEFGTGVPVDGWSRRSGASALRGW